MSGEKSELKRFYEFVGNSNLKNLKNELIEGDIQYNIWLLLKKFYEKEGSE